MDPSPEQMAARLRLAFDLYEAAEELFRQRLRRESPAMPDEEIETAIRAWLRHRPGAEHGDAEGRPVPLERFGL